MRRNWFQFTLWLGFAAAVLGLLLTLPTQAAVRAQDAATDTPAVPSSSAYITQTYTEAINVRTGPSTVFYPVIGQLPIGATAPAIGASPSREWIEIVYPGGPDGVGWIYAANVTLTGSVKVVEPPPTATPLATATIDPTLAAAFSVEPTETRLPTFTPPPPLVVPHYSNASSPIGGFPLGAAIASIAVVGVLVLGASYLGRR